MSELELAQAKWQSSGLTDEHAKLLGFEVLDAQQTAALGSNFRPQPSLKIPYFDFEGKAIGFYRVRYLGPDVGIKAQTEKGANKYDQPTGQRGLYLPPLFQKSWSAIASDPNVDIIITEGELKSALAGTLGYPTIGLGGCWNWISKGEVLPEIGSIKWKGRKVIVVFDSDVATNDQVRMSEVKLCRELLNRGANPCYAHIPALPDKKVGLDDFYLAQGEKAVDQLFDNAMEFEESSALWDFNEEVAFIFDPGAVIRLSDGFLMNHHNFATSHYANRHFIETTITKKGPKIEKKPLAKRWLEWEHRRQLDGITYAPGKLRITDNRWNQWSSWGCKPKEGDVSPWHDLLDLLFRGTDSEDRRWFEQWAAYPLQNPGVKLFTAVVMWGLHEGTGKTLAGYLLGDIYGENFFEAKKPDLTSDFNQWQRYRQFVMGDEVTGGESRVFADKLKGLVTQEEVTINQKYVPLVTVPDCINYYFTSNHVNAFFLSDQDRRFFVNEVKSKPASQAFYQAVADWRAKGGASALFHYLLNLDLTGFNPSAPARATQSKADMIYESKSDADRWAIDLMLDPTDMLKKSGIFSDAAVEARDLFTPTELYQAYLATTGTDFKPQSIASAFGRILKQAGAVLLPLTWTKLGPKRLTAIRNLEQWAGETTDHIRAHYDKWAL